MSIHPFIISRYIDIYIVVNNLRLKYPLFFITLGIFGIINTELGVVGILPMIMDKYKISATVAGMLVRSFASIIALFGPWMTLLFSKINQR
ncbi:hypothetical protein SAMN05216191_10347 [Paenibacillus jilunlii]|uniref:Major Facilitator Superfamily protein n=1 Tax=Paenibacillus jilunlii TaxID=682956 RepID=A0A1G9JYR9_9BACL|nr:hypothetical protein SAMN05216191_10347 [Paenibacillus jilunlii]